MDSRTFKITSTGSNVPLKITPGHFATNHSHINYYLDMTTLKARMSEARLAAKALMGMYVYDTVVDTIVCLDGTQIIGACLADELTNAGFMSRNAHQTIYVLAPEYNTNSQMVFRENTQPMITGKHVIILMASITTGKTIAKAMECIPYYRGVLAGIAAVFSALETVDHIHVNSIFGMRDLPDYGAHDFRDCPFCQRGEKLDALVNSFGYSKI